VKINLLAVRDEATEEAYAFFELQVRRLPKRKNGKINIRAHGLEDNDVDAFRHAYVSGVFTQEYGERAATYLGSAYEYTPWAQYSNTLSPGSRNMDLWNNKIGRKYGKKTRGRKALLKLIYKALKNGELITDPTDPRKFNGAKEPPKRISRPIIALSKLPSGRNQTYFDLQNGLTLSREELVTLIRAGKYLGYSIKIIRGVETPVSKKDGRRINNIG
jgi:hypothetical protein